MTTRPTQDRNRKGDISALNSVLSPVQGYRNAPRQTIAPPTTGPASTLYQGLRRGGNAKANAQSLAETFNTNSEAAATAVASAATEGGSSAAVAEAVAQTTVSHPGIAPGENNTAPAGGTVAALFGALRWGNHTHCGQLVDTCAPQRVQHAASMACISTHPVR